jgi:hypothetical protein
MMEKCFDEVILQAFLDNELPLELSQNVARHVADCDSCAILLAEVEEETSFTFNALEQEFDTLVPTNRLWTKINESIETQSRNQSLWYRISNFRFQISDFKLNMANVAAFASLLMIVGVVTVLIVVKNNNVSGDVAEKKPPIQTVQTAKIDNTAPIIQPPISVPVTETKPRNTANPQFRVEKANFVKSEPSRKPEVETPIVTPKPQPAAPQYLDGEESYVNTIARLEKTVDGNKDEVLKPSARFAYEKDLAVVNDTIDKMKKEVKKNPKNEGAKQVLFSSYQNKIELLNSVTQRSELMASMR